MYAWSPINSPINHLHPLTKAYLLLFVILFMVFFGNIYVLTGTILCIVLLIIVSNVPIKLIWNNIKSYAFLLVPFVFLLSWFENSDIKTMILTATIVYVQFMSVFIVGAVYSLTTNFSDISLFFFKYKSLRNFGIALAIGFSSMSILEQKVKNVIVLQKLRGAVLSLNPLKIDKTFIALQALIIPLILQTVELSHEFSDALVARGYNLNRELELPPNLRFHFLDTTVILFSSLILILVLAGS